MNNENMTPLCMAIYYGAQTNIVTRLLNHHAIDVNKKIMTGDGVIHLALKLEHDDITMQLFNHPGTDINMHGMNNMTPLDIASGKKNVFITQLLISELVKRKTLASSLLYLVWKKGLPTDVIKSIVEYIYRI